MAKIRTISVTSKLFGGKVLAQMKLTQNEPSLLCSIVLSEWENKKAPQCDCEALLGLIRMGAGAVVQTPNPLT